MDKDKGGGVVDIGALKKEAMEVGLKRAVVDRLTEIQYATRASRHSEFRFNFDSETLRECMGKCSKLIFEINTILDELSIKG